MVSKVESDMSLRGLAVVGSTKDLIAISKGLAVITHALD